MLLRAVWNIFPDPQHEGLMTMDVFIVLAIFMAIVAYYVYIGYKSADAVNGSNIRDGVACEAIGIQDAHEDNPDSITLVMTFETISGKRYSNKETVPFDMPISSPERFASRIWGVIHDNCDYPQNFGFTRHNKDDLIDMMSLRRACFQSFGITVNPDARFVSATGISFTINSEIKSVVRIWKAHASNSLKGS